MTATAGGLFVMGVLAMPPQKARKLDFNRDVRPVLDKCITCHGHDPTSVRAGLRLDSRAGATAKLRSGNVAIVPGKPDQSELIKRVFAKDPSDVMPPEDSNKTLSKEEKQILRDWIAQGAEYKQHWSFTAPVRQPAPAVKLKSWPKNTIDSFVLAKLEENGLKPSPQADKRTLIRRVSLDLTGIPPTPEEVNAFLADKSPNAYEKVVDRLLASNRYGERMAMEWLDYARYADSNGYQADWERFQWRWRDWVIDAFNLGMPFDQFTIKQIAGDMLPDATLEDKIATGFNRNHRINTEGGVIAEEWRVENVIDRVETTSYTWLGLTSGCARCHNHKYDPITQKDFYSLYAYFNNVPESGTGVEAPVNHAPVMKAPTKEQTAMLAKYDAQIAEAGKKLEAMSAQNASKAAAWKLDPSVLPVLNGRLAHYRLGKTSTVLYGSVPTPQAISEVSETSGKFGSAVQVMDRGYLDLGQVGDFDSKDSFTYSLWVNSANGNGVPVSKMDAPNNYQGWDLFLQGGRPAFHLISSWPSNALKVVSRAKIANNTWNYITVTYSGNSKPDGVKIYVNGVDAGVDVETNSLNGSTKTPVTCKVGRRTGGETFNGQVEDLIFYNRALSRDEAKKLFDTNAAAGILAIPADKRTKEQSASLVHLWSRANDAAYRKEDDARADLQSKKTALDGQITTVMVMEEMKTPRKAFILERGQYDHPAQEVKAALPAFLPPLPKGAPNNRLGLAKWLVDPSNPLTARVVVNRMWERLFGTGIVETSEDFGTRSTFPTHPELLDWLATEFVRTGWSQKAVWKELVMSAAYQQSSVVTKKLLEVDPQNKLISRGPRFRLTAEVIRDQAMYFGGILTEKVGGPSVRPYQPNGIWDEMNVYGNLRNYKNDTNENLRRRSLYTIWKRTAAPPNMTIFDMSTREMCRIRRARTNTPLQALNMMNDVTYLEASRALALRIMKEGGTTPETRIKRAFNIVLSRDPSTQEVAILTKGLNRELAAFKANPANAEKFIKIGELPNPTNVNVPTLAAYTLVASTLINLDETITKE